MDCPLPCLPEASSHRNSWITLIFLMKFSCPKTDLRFLGWALLTAPIFAGCFPMALMAPTISQIRNPNHIWLVVYLPLCKMMELVSWGYEIPNWMEKKTNVPNHQPNTVGGISHMTSHYWLVVSSGKIWVRQWEGLSHILWKIKFMFETTNQIV